MNTTLPIILMVLSSFLAAIGQLSLKLGSAKLRRSFKHIIMNYSLMAGVFCYGAAAVLNIIALRGSELSILYPIASLNYVWVSFLSMRYLKEKMNKLKWAGICLIVIGVWVIL